VQSGDSRQASSLRVGQDSSELATAHAHAASIKTATGRRKDIAAMMPDGSVTRLGD
jgi:hypothetical protein